MPSGGATFIVTALCRGGICSPAPGAVTYWPNSEVVMISSLEMPRTDVRPVICSGEEIAFNGRSPEGTGRAAIAFTASSAFVPAGMSFVATYALVVLSPPTRPLTLCPYRNTTSAPITATVAPPTIIVRDRICMSTPLSLLPSPSGDGYLFRIRQQGAPAEERLLDTVGSRRQGAETHDVRGPGGDEDAVQ